MLVFCIKFFVLINSIYRPTNASLLQGLHFLHTTKHDETLSIYHLWNLDFSPAVKRIIKSVQEINRNLAYLNFALAGYLDTMIKESNSKLLTEKPEPSLVRSMGNFELRLGS